MVLWQGENEHLSVILFEDASASIRDHQTGAMWQMGRVAMQEDNIVDWGHCWLRTERSPCEEYPARFRGEVEGDHLRFTLIGQEGQAVGQFCVEPRLNGSWLDFRIFDIDASLPSLVFPTPIESESLIFPQNQGRWVKEPLNMPYWWVYPVHLRMRWFGGLRGDQGWIAILHEGYADGGTLATQLSASPAWLRSMGKWNGERVVRYGFTSGGYVGMAKAYRAYAIEQGMFRSLAEKLDERPAGRSLLGGHVLSFFMAEAKHRYRYEDRYWPVPGDLPAEGKSPDVYISYTDAARLIDHARAEGAERGLVVLRGWINGGYDESHPDIFPYEPSLGTVNELQGLLALDQRFTAALHDNYQDIYPQSPSFPKGIIRTHNGRFMRGGVWAGGQSYLINARDGLANARHNWNELCKLNPQAMFIDTTIGVQMYENYAPEALQTRADDLRDKKALLQFFRDEGQIVGSEEGSDFGVPLVEWIENRHMRTPGVSIPLWPLVFHDAAFCTRYLRPVDDGLTDLLWGYMLLWDFRQRETWEANLAGIKKLTHVADWHRRIGLDEMLSHRYLSEDGQVEETVFSSGVAVRVNFAGEARTVEGKTLSAGQYQILE
ncbi:MAG: DUF5696 domain-containing protein [bacterium]|nr:DUF5696 domain-containing protein [bacterium]